MQVRFNLKEADRIFAVGFIESSAADQREKAEIKEKRK
jgi:hypothetical protein